MRILGIDPGYAHCGIAVIERASPSESWEVRFQLTVVADARWDLADRIHRVYYAVSTALGAHAPVAAVAVEAQRRSQAGHRERGTSSDEALGVREVVGVLRCLSWQFGLGDLIEVEPQTWRKCLALHATADKRQVQRAVRAVVKNCPKTLTEHVADAIGTAVAGARLMHSTQK